LALGVGVLIGSSPPDPPTKEWQQQYAAAKARYAQAVAGKLADPDANYSAYPDESAYECYYAKQHDSADLCAQWRAAIAAEGSARWTFWAFVVSVAGTALSGVALVGLLLSLRQTERALAEGITANAIAEDTAKRQLRAYVLPSKAHFTIAEDGTIDATLKIQNFGQTPALEKTSWMHFWIADFPLKEDLPNPPDDFEMSVGIIGPGNYTEFQDSRPRLSECAVRGIEDGSAALYLYGQIKYVDVFGEPHTSDFVYFTNAKVGWGKGRFSHYTSGNTTI